MIYREATVADIKQLFFVRMSVKENILNNIDLVTDEICAEYLTRRGKGWLCEIDNYVVGFAIADLVDHNIWALFVRPEYERKGIGRKLQDIMLNWYFSLAQEKVWLGTSPNTRAETFYERTGWRKIGLQANGEIRFEMTAKEWKSKRRSSSTSHL